MKQQIEALLHQALARVIQEDHYPALTTPPMILIERPRDLTHGDFSSNLAMMLAKPFGVAPRALAERLVASLPSDEAIAHVSIAGAGFINFTLSQHQLVLQLQSIAASSTCGVLPAVTPQTVVVDYSSPNLAKEMHVGHLRSTIIGDALARVLAYKGHRVIRQNHVGDWGTQFGMLLAHLDDLEQAHSAEVQLDDLEIFYKAAKQRFDQEPGFSERAREWVVLLQSGDAHCLELWSMFIRLSLSHCQAVYERLGVMLTQDDVRAESAYNPVLSEIVQDLREQGLLVEDAGAQCVFLEGFKGKDNEPIPIIVQKKDGGFLYASTDLAAIRYRAHTLHADRLLYVVDARQSLHFQQVFALAQKAGFAPLAVQLEHVGFGMVLDKTGRPYKSRDGGVTKLADLLDEAERRAAELISSKQPGLDDDALKHMAKVVGIASVKYADLSKNRISDYVFDWDTMLSFEGNTAPYLLYAYTRVSSLFTKAGLTPEDVNGPFMLSTEQDTFLAKQLVRFPEVIDTVITKAMPHFLCTYLYELAGAFSTFYEACPILNQDDASLKQSRLRLAALTARILEQGLGLIGIQTLTRM